MSNVAMNQGRDGMDDQHEVRLLGWSSSGLRCPDYAVDFRKPGGGTHRVTLLQMPNGTGKTTTLQLLRASLCGRSPDGRDWANYPIGELRKAGGGDTGEFVVDLLAQGKRWSFRLKFYFDRNEVDLFTTGPTGEDIGFKPPRTLEPFLNANFVRFFVFDGELAAELTDAAKQNAGEAVDAMFQLNAFSAMQMWGKRYLDSKVQKQREGGAGATQTWQGIERKKTYVAEIESRLFDLKSEFTKLEEEGKQLKHEELELINQAREAVRQQAEYRDRQDAALKDKNACESHLKKVRADLLDAARDPHQLSPAFARVMLEIRRGFDEVKLPEKSSREWFREIADNAEKCICGTKLEPHHREHIRSESERYLGSDAVVLLDRIKQDVAQKVGEFPEGSDTNMRRLAVELDQCLEKLGRAEEAYQRVQDEAANENPEIKRTRERLEAIQQLQRELAIKLDRFDRPNQTDRPRVWNNIPETDRELSRQKSILAAQTGTVELSEKQRALDELLDKVRRLARDRLGESLTRDVNASLDELMPDNRVRLASVGRSLKLLNRGGASVGETLTVAYSFLTRLSNGSRFGLPLIVDTPAAAVDQHIRGEIGRSLPRMVGQFIAFTISPERGPFIKALIEGSGGDLQYLTLFRSTNERLMRSLDAAGLATDDVRVSADARLVRGEAFFNAFQDDSKYEKHAAI